MKISHKLCVRMDGTQFLSLWWFTAKNEGGNHKRAWVYIESQYLLFLNYPVAGSKMEVF